MAKSSGGTGRVSRDIIREGISAGSSVSRARQTRRDFVATRGTSNLRRPSRRIRGN